MRKFKIWFWVVLIIFLIALVLVMYNQLHIYTEATCSSPAKCKLCGKTQGEPLEHQWNVATCTTPQTCKLCKKTTGSVLPHKYENATCNKPKTCTKCGATLGTKLQHSYIDATCTSPKKCTRCNITVGTELGHEWINATCQSPKKCARCLKTTGSVVAHDYTVATCTSASYCKFCGISKGTPKEHSYYAGECTSCGKKDANFFGFTQKDVDISYKILGIPQSSIAITNMSYEVSGSTIYVYLDIKKTFDLLGKNNHDRCYFSWTLYTSSGVVVKSGNQVTIELRKGDKIDNYCIKITGIEMSKKYRFKLFPYELFD